MNKTNLLLRLLFAACVLTSFLSCGSADATNTGENKTPATETAEAEATKFLGSWQGLTYGSGPYDPMFTLVIKPKGVWTDLTFGEARAIDAKYEYDSKKQELTLFTAQGNKLYTFKIEPASAEHKEHMVEQTPPNEYYKAMICYRKS